MSEPDQLAAVSAQPGALGPYRLPRGAFVPGAGLTWVAPLPPDLDHPGDSMDDPCRSRLDLFEDAAPLGPRHSLHADIAQSGRGAYSHWHDALFFSTSDGSDPNTSGREYSILLGNKTLKILPFGSCNLYDSLNTLQNRRLAYLCWQTPLPIQTPREMLQVIQHHFGEIRLPDRLRSFMLPTDPADRSLPKAAREADVLILEVGRAFDVTCNGAWLLRSKLWEKIVNPIGELGAAERRLVRRWESHGLVRRNEGVRRACVEQLVELLPRVKADHSDLAEIILGARGVLQDTAAATDTIREICRQLRIPAVCVLSTQNLFTPDGRPVNWPGNFPKELELICRDLDIPLMHESRLVAEHGVAFSLEADLVHYTPAFHATLGEAILAFAERSIRNARSAPADRG